MNNIYLKEDEVGHKESLHGSRASVAHPKCMGCKEHEWDLGNHFPLG